MEQDALREVIAQRLAYYRKRMGLTQLELAEKINYSDKSVSKWERGDGVPDIFVLKELADLYGITVNDLVCAEIPLRKPCATERRRRALIPLLSVGLVWLLACLIYFTLRTVGVSGRIWLVYLVAIPVSAVVCIVFTALWWGMFWQFCSVALLIWGTALCIAVSFSADGVWFIYIVATVLQALETVWFLLRRERRHTT